MSRSDFLKELSRSFDEVDEERHNTKHAQKYGDAIENITGIRPTFGPAPDVPDYPPCDCCGKEFDGKLTCAGCTCVFYCSKECQRHDWKVNGHKSACDTMMQQCENAATCFLDAICDGNFPMDTNIQASVWSALDGAGAYKIALDLGLNGAIQKLMEDEIENAEDRFRSGKIISSTQMIMCTLFRDGRHNPRRVLSSIDTYRIKKYVRSSEDAFERWFEASLTTISIFITQGTGMTASRGGNDAHFWMFQRSIRNLVDVWSMVFANTKASKVILLGKSKEADESAKARAKWIIQQLKQILPQFPQDSPDDNTIENHVNTFTAMIQIRLKNFGVDVGDFLLLLGFKGTRKLLYNDVFIPFAEATIQKGNTLTTEEYKEVLKTHAQTELQSGGMHRRADANASSSTSIRGKKKGKRRARK